MSALAPEEITSVRRLYKSVVDKAQQGKVITATAHPLDGLDLRLDGLTYTTTALGSGVARVNLTGGTLGYDVDSTAASPLLNELRGANGRTTESTTVSGVVADIDGHNREATNPVSGAVRRRRQAARALVREPRVHLAGIPARRCRAAEAGLHRPRQHQAHRRSVGQRSGHDIRQRVSSVDPHRIITALPPEELGELYDHEQDLRADIEQSQGLKASDVTMTLDPPDVSESPIADGRMRVDINRLSGVLAAVNGRGRSFRADFTLSDAATPADVECLVRRGAQRGADKTESVCSQSPMFKSGG